VAALAASLHYSHSATAGPVHPVRACALRAIDCRNIAHVRITERPFLLQKIGDAAVYKAHRDARMPSAAHRRRGRGKRGRGGGGHNGNGQRNGRGVRQHTARDQETIDEAERLLDLREVRMAVVPKQISSHSPSLRSPSFLCYDLFLEVSGI
jgi:hypothetical protein